MLLAILIGLAVPTIILVGASRSEKPTYDECDYHGGGF